MVGLNHVERTNHCRQSLVFSKGLGLRCGFLIRSFHMIRWFCIYYPVRICTAGLCVWLHPLVCVCIYIIFIYVCIQIFVCKQKQAF